MANEITSSCSLAFSKNAIGASVNQAAVQFTMTGTNYSECSVVTNNATVTAIPLGSIGTPGYLLVQNLDAANSVDFYPTTGGVASARIPPKTAMLLYCVGATPGLKSEASTPACNCLVLEA
jgi:hypothetical protein